MKTTEVYNYTVSVIENNNKIERLNFVSKKAATKIYKTMYFIARYYGDIEGVQLWEHRKDKTIDSDPHARIIEQYYK